MKKKQKLIVLMLIIILALIAGIVLSSSRQSRDGCTQHDRDINNCVPVGRCAPPDVSDANLDCDNSHEHKFNTEL